MAAQVLNLSVEQGATFHLSVVLDPVVDLTGMTGTCEIRAQASPLYPVVVSPTITVDTVTPELGMFDIDMTAAQTAGIPCLTGVGIVATYSTTVKYYFDIKFTDGTAVVRGVNGYVTVSPGVTLS